MEKKTINEIINTAKLTKDPFIKEENLHELVLLVDYCLIRSLRETTRREGFHAVYSYHCVAIGRTTKPEEIPLPILNSIKEVGGEAFWIMWQRKWNELRN